jgi:hypothetical protein
MRCSFQPREWVDRVGLAMIQKGSQSSDVDFKRSRIPGTRRSTETTIVVSSKTLPVADIDLLAAFPDDPIQFRAFGFGKNFGATFDG